MEVRGRKMVEREVRSTDRIADRDANARGLDGLAHGPQWNLNPTAPCKG